MKLSYNGKACSTGIPNSKKKRILFKNHTWFCILFFFVTVVSQLGCTKLVQVDAPVTSLSSANVYSTDITAASVLTGLYASISHNTVGLSNLQPTINGISLHLALSSDELTLYGGASNANTDLLNFYINSLNNQSDKTFWEDLYSNIYIVNIAVERLGASGSLSVSVKQQLIGEAKFMRAFFYFNLVNLYGDVPLVTSSDYRTNAIFVRTPAKEIWKQILSDLIDAQNLLSNDYLGGDAKTITTERIRPNKWVATALLARAYLYTKNWKGADSAASAVINNSKYGLVPIVANTSDVFAKNSAEAIWQMQPVNEGWNTEDAKVFVLPAAGPDITNGGYPVYLDSNLVNSFELNDLRKMNWIGSVIPLSNSAIYYFPYKYKIATQGDPVTEYTMMLRLGEQYLIRAEARAQQNNIGGAQNDLNTIRTRAGLPNTSANDVTSLATAVLNERRHELFTEWGHRWFDLKRTGNVDSVMAIVCPLKGGSWNSNWMWYPLPIYDLQQDPYLIQNSGY